MSQAESREHMKERVVTPEQLNKGWFEFIPDGIPNMIRHEYFVIRKLPNGNFVVRDYFREPIKPKGQHS